ncbi:MAG: adenosylmethionine-8-amino-7-oxononanoate aminotransferase [Frankiales bacterium]|nr:adenosylmethionine-8-amino-7-oxononanoate aminotransferase [Frankiales bacterium]
MSPLHLAGAWGSGIGETGAVTTTLDGTALLDADRAHVWHPYASATAPLPVLPVVAARGTRLVLADGRELVDGMSSWWAAVHGYGHPVLDAALHAQVDRLGHVMFGGLTHEPAVELASLLVSLTPAPLTRVFFADSGSVAVEVALKMALQHWRGLGRTTRTRVLTVRGGYHGDTLGCMSVTDPVGGMHSLFAEYVPQQLFAPPPRPRYDEEVRDDDLADVARLLEEHTDQVACVIVEPVVQGAGGMRFYAPEYLRRLRALCDAHDVLLVLDEIATGFGRTGELFGADHAGVVADIVCLGKALTGGYLSLAAVLCTDEVAAGVSACGALMHGPTFMANPLACAMGIASTRLLLSRDWRAEVAGIGDALREGLAPAAELPQVRDVRVLGAIGVVELHEPVDMAVLQPALVERGAWVRPFGRLVYAMPPFVSSPQDVAVVTSAIVGAVRDVC